MSLGTPENSAIQKLSIIIIIIIINLAQWKPSFTVTLKGRDMDTGTKERMSTVILSDFLVELVFVWPWAFSCMAIWFADCDGKAGKIHTG